MSSLDERKAHIEGVFRSANETLEGESRGILAGDVEAPVPFLCECPDPSCVAVVMLTLTEYEQIRSGPRQGLALPGHEDDSIERVLERHERYVLTEKVGRAGDIHAEGDARNESR